MKAAFYWMIKTLAWPATHGYVRMRVEGAGRVPRKGACIVVANHASYVDPAVLGSACPRRLTFMISRRIYRLLRMRWFYYMMGAIPVSPDAPDPGAMKRALRAIRRGGALGIFPEGQRMADGNLGAGKAGVALLAARTGAPVVPAAIMGAHRVMPVGAIFPRPRPIRVVFGPPMEFVAPDGGRPSRDDLQRFAELVMAQVRDLIDSQGEPAARRREPAPTAGS